jgi:sec-independent protein translocase protein TatC
MTTLKLPRGRQAKDPDGRMPLIEHIRELRNRIMKAAAGLIVGMILGWVFFKPVWNVLQRPYKDLGTSHCYVVAGRCSLIVSSVFDGFYLHLKIAFVIGIVVSSPIWLYQIWSFVAPGLYQRERKWTYIFLGTSIPLFAVGATFAYYFVQKGLHFLIGMAPTGVTAMVSVQSYLTYVIAVLLVFGLTFELPLFVVILNFAHVMSHQFLRKHLRMMIFLVFLFAGVATPSPDPFTMLALAVPTVVLFMAAYMVTAIVDRRRAARAADYSAVSDDAASPLDMGDLDEADRPLPPVE